MKENKLKYITLLPVVFFVVGCSGSTKPPVTPSHMVELANQYIEDNKDNVDNSRKPTFHVSPPIGWINDPNGFSEFGGKYHLF